MPLRMPGDDTEEKVMSIEGRRSIRKYTNQPVEKAVIEEVIRAAALAPSAKNRQPWKYLVYAGAEKEKLVDQMEIGLYREREVSPILPESAFGLPDAYNTLRIMREAPVILVVLNTNGRNPYKEIDTDRRISEICDSLSIGASIENLILKAEDLGLGTLWIANTFFAYPELVEYIGTEDQLVSAVALGYPAEAPAARPRKPLEEIVEFM